MRPDFYRPARAAPKDSGEGAIQAAHHPPKLPNIHKLVESGASADAVESIYPTTTYPAHATIVTGVAPRNHGIYSHLASLDPTEQDRPWTWFAGALQVPAIWDVARASLRKTAAVSWPVSAGAPIDYNLPEIWDPAAPDPHQDLQSVAQHATRGLFPEILRLLQPILKEASPDRLRAEAAIHLWKRYRPDLLLVHFIHYDQLAHRHGPDSREALKALEETDEQIGRVRQALSEDSNATLVVLSDHGFVPVEKEVAPQVALSAEGLFETARKKHKLKKLGAIHAGGSFAIYWLEEPEANERKALAKAVEQLRATGAIEEVVDRAKLEALGSDPDAELMLDAAPGFYFTDTFDAPIVRKSTKDHGTHGHLPTRAGLEASFIAAGPGIPAGKNLGKLSLMQVAPTLARLLGLPAHILASESEPLDLYPSAAEVE